MEMGLLRKLKGQRQTKAQDDSIARTRRVSLDHLFLKMTGIYPDIVASLQHLVLFEQLNTKN
jgi:hypothetical protein